MGAILRASPSRVGQGLGRIEDPAEINRADKDQDDQRQDERQFDNSPAGVRVLPKIHVCHRAMDAVRKAAPENEEAQPLLLIAPLPFAIVSVFARKIVHVVAVNDSELGKFTSASGM